MLLTVPDQWIFQEKCLLCYVCGRANCIQIIFKWTYTRWQRLCGFVENSCSPKLTIRGHAKNWKGAKIFIASPLPFLPVIIKWKFSIFSRSWRPLFCLCCCYVHLFDMVTLYYYTCFSDIQFGLIVRCDLILTQCWLLSIFYGELNQSMPFPIIMIVTVSGKRYSKTSV